MAGRQLVPIIVTDQLSIPSGAAPPNGSTQFVLTEEIIAPQECSAAVIGADYIAGLLAQQLVANDLDSSGDPISPATTMYEVRQNVDGSAPVRYFVTVPSVPPDARVVHDAITTLGSGVITSATANFTVDDLIPGYVLVNNGDLFPPGTQIMTVVSSTTAILTRTASMTAVGASLMIGASVSLGTLRPPE